MKRSFLSILLAVFAMLSVAQTTGMKPYTVSIQELEPYEVRDKKQKAAHPQRKFKPSKRGKESYLTIAYKDVFSKYPDAIAVYKIAPSFIPASYLIIESDKLIFVKNEWEALKSDEANERREKKNKDPKIKKTKRTAAVDEEFRVAITDLLEIASRTASSIHVGGATLDGTRYSLIPYSGYSQYCGIVAAYTHEPQHGTPACNFVNVMGDVCRMVDKQQTENWSELMPAIAKNYEDFLKFVPKECSDYDLYEAILKKMQQLSKQ
ncbi:MAG: hypothetical protein KBT33_10490 [Prevotellaceae bacterium]|nr:hypothetical protein [Candidatus Minthosoma equi]